MTGFLVTVAIVYLLGAIVFMRVYLGRRCGVSYSWMGRIPLTDTGVLPAAFIGMAWPVTIFTHRSPAPCNHRSHVLARAQAQSQWESEEEQIRQAQDRNS